MRKWSWIKSKKALATGLTTAVVLTSITIPVVASSDYSLVSITAMVEEYISESPAVDPVAELIGKEEPEVSIQKSSGVVTAAPKAAKTAKETEGKEKNPAAEDESIKDESVKDSKASSKVLSENSINKLARYTHKVLDLYDLDCNYDVNQERCRSCQRRKNLPNN